MGYCNLAVEEDVATNNFANIRTLLCKAQRKVFGKWLFYQTSVDEYGNIIPMRRLGPLNQWLMEKGYTPPWIFTQRECQEYWKSITNTSSANRPSEYAAKSQEIVQFLHQFWAPHIGTEDIILELGCNCGANLNGLLCRGYKHLHGMEINETAISQMKCSFPDLAGIATILVGSLEELLPKAPTAGVDVIFTMAVLIHIHPRSNYLFDEMVRVARKYICVVENETANCAYVFSRNYRRVFERLGCSHVKSVLITKSAFPETPSGYYGYTARLFQVPQTKGMRPLIG